MHAPTAPPIEPNIKGFINLMFTPKIAGSVIPSIQESEEGNATLFIFAFLLFNATARQAPPCATFAAQAIGSQYVKP